MVLISLSFLAHTASAVLIECTVHTMRYGTCAAGGAGDSPAMATLVGDCGDIGPSSALAILCNSHAVRLSWGYDRSQPERQEKWQNDHISDIFLCDIAHMCSLIIRIMLTLDDVSYKKYTHSHIHQFKYNNLITLGSTYLCVCSP